MKRLFDRLLPKIWTRLFLMIVTAVLLTWAVIGIALYWLGNAQALVHTFSTEHTPRLMQTTDLAAQASDLAVLSNRILYSNADTPNTFENDLRVSVDQLNQMLRNFFSTPEMQAQSLDLQRQLAGVIRSLDRARRFETTLRGQVDRLRWINVDIQDEITPLVADFSFNIAALIRGLTQENDPAERRRQAEVLMAEQALYRTFVDIGTEASIASTLAVEGSASMQNEQLEQFAGLLSDALSRLNGQLQELPLKAEYVTLRQSIEALNQITVGQGSIVSIRRNWLEERRILSQQLEASLSGLSALQSLVQNLSADRRAEILSTSEAFETSASRTVRLLVGMTIFAALAALIILFAYIRPAIIRPLDHLTAAMRAIAEGRQPRLVDLPARNDEISQLAGAVAAFRDSVQERDRAIEQLQQTQSELVQTGKMAALGNLSAGLSHELNQPLGAIRQRLHMTGRALERADVATAALAVPGVVLGIGYLRTFHSVDVPFVGEPLASWWVVIALALMIRRLPYALRACMAALQQVSLALEEAAESLGATKKRTIYKIVVPLMKGGLLAGFVTSFATAAVELSATIMLVSSNQDAPLAYGIYLFMQTPSGRGAGAALGVVAVLLVAAGTLASQIIIERDKKAKASADMH